MSDDIIQLPTSTPPLGDTAYGDIERVRETEDYASVSYLRTAGDEAVGKVLDSGVSLGELTQAVHRAQRRSACAHPSSTIYPKSRTLVCNECGAEWSSFDLLLRLARGERTLYRNIVDRDALRRETQILRANRERLKREVQNAKAKLKRARISKEKAQAATDLERALLRRYQDLHRLQRIPRETFNAMGELERKGVWDEQVRLRKILDEHLPDEPLDDSEEGDEPGAGACQLVAALDADGSTRP